MVLVAFAVFVVGGVAVFKYRVYFNKPTLEGSNLPQAQSLQEAGQEKDIPKAAVLAQNLEIPWSLVFLPDRSILFTERPGRVRVVDSHGVLKPEPIFTFSDTKSQGEGGLLGTTIHPKFNENKYVYFYYTYSGGENTLNRVVRFEFKANSLTDRKVIVDAIPGAGNHNGGRIKFGPDGYLYITAGDSQNPSLAQDKNSLAGKILRVTDDGGVVPENPFVGVQGKPFASLIYSYGHRNPQGLTWDDSGRLFATEHGNNAHDELNLIEKGNNYGWPNVVGSAKRSDIKSPILQSGDDTWAPGGIVFYNGSLFFVGLRGKSLYEVKGVLDTNAPTLNVYFKNEYGRLRDIVVGPDGLFYILTSNRDGRGSPQAGDDKILVVNPKKL